MLSGPLRLVGAVDVLRDLGDSRPPEENELMLEKRVPVPMSQSLTAAKENVMGVRVLSVGGRGSAKGGVDRGSSVFLAMASGSVRPEVPYIPKRCRASGRLRLLEDRFKRG